MNCVVIYDSRQQTSTCRCAFLSLFILLILLLSITGDDITEMISLPDGSQEEMLLLLLLLRLCMLPQRRRI